MTPIAETEITELETRAGVEQERRQRIQEVFPQTNLVMKDDAQALADMARWGQLNVMRLVEEVRGLRARLGCAAKYMDALKEVMLHEHNELIESAGRLPKPRTSKESAISEWASVRDAMLGKIPVSEDVEKTRLLGIIKARVGDMQHRDEEIKRIQVKLEIANGKVNQRDDEWAAIQTAKHEALEEVSRLKRKTNKLVRRLRYQRARHNSDRAVWTTLLTSVRIMGHEKLRQKLLGAVLTAIEVMKWGSETEVE